MAQAQEFAEKQLISYKVSRQGQDADRALQIGVQE